MATPAEFAAVRPRLFHMAEPATWRSVLERGLLSTSAALDLHGLSGAAREALERTRRAEITWLDHPEHGRFPVRDQHPMTDPALRRCLKGGLEPADWYALLNARAFLWADPARLERMLRTPAYRANPYVVFAVDTLSFAEAHGDRLEMSFINTGSTVRKAARRGRESFVRLADLARRDIRRVAEATVLRAAPDFAAHVVEAELRGPGGQPGPIIFSGRTTSSNSASVT